MTLGEKIRLYRKEAKMTQAELAKKAGLSLMSIRRYETGERYPKANDCRAIAWALNAPIGEFFADILRDASNGIFQTASSFSEDQSITVRMNEIDPKIQEEVFSILEKLNYEGQSEALKQVKLVAEIPRYQKK